MGKEMYTVRIGTETRQYEDGTPYLKIAQDFQENYK